MRLIIIGFAILLCSCIQEPIIVNETIGVFDRTGSTFQYEIAYEINFADDSKIEHKNMVRNEVIKMVQRTLCKYDLEDIAILKRDSIELYTCSMIKKISSNEIKISNIKMKNLIVSESLYRLFNIRYGELNRIKKS